MTVCSLDLLLQIWGSCNDYLLVYGLVFDCKLNSACHQNASPISTLNRICLDRWVSWDWNYRWRSRRDCDARCPLSAYGWLVRLCCWLYTCFSECSCKYSSCWLLCLAIFRWSKKKREYCKCVSFCCIFLYRTKLTGLILRKGGQKLSKVKMCKDSKARRSRVRLSSFI